MKTIKLLNAMQEITKMCGQLEVPAVESEIKEAYLLAESECGSLPVESKGECTIIQLPLKAPDSIDTVVVLEID